MTSKGYTFTPENYVGKTSGKSYTFTPENAVGKGYSPDEQEGFWKSAARTALQVPQGIAEATPYGISTGLFALGALGESDLDIETWHKLRELAEQEGKEFDEESYEQARQEMLGMIPTVSNIASKIEEETGLPLEPKTKIQKGLRLGSTAAKFQPGSMGQKSIAGLAAPATSEALQAIGVPEVFADPLGLGVAIPAGSKGPKFDIGKSKKPSGLAERQFEGITKPTEVPQKKINKINDKLEKDFREISDNIIKNSPIGETAENLAKDPTYKQESRELLNQAQEIADATPGNIPSKSIKKEYADVTAKNVKGYALGEYDKAYLKYMKESIEDVVGKDVTHGQLVEQYRKNNRELGEIFEPGSSKAVNRAKKDALLDQNRAIANIIEKSNPELSQVFKDGNQRWTKIMDAEAVDGFINEIFPEGGKVNYKKMHDLFDKHGYDRIFKRALGDEGYKAFEQLTKDMLTSEAPYKMLKVAKEKGWSDLYQTASSYILHPKLGQAKLGLDALKYGYRGIINAMLDKPKFSLTWKKAVDDLKKGNFKKADKAFKTLEAEVEILPKEEAPIKSKQFEDIEAKVTPIEETKQLEAPKKQIELKETKVPEDSYKIDTAFRSSSPETMKKIKSGDIKIGDGRFGKGFYMAESEQAAKTWAFPDKEILKMDLDNLNFKNFNSYENLFEEAIKSGMPLKETKDFAAGNGASEKNLDNFKRYILEKGYDGIRVGEGIFSPGYEEIVIYNEKNIKKPAETLKPKQEKVLKKTHFFEKNKKKTKLEALEESLKSLEKELNSPKFTASRDFRKIEDKWKKYYEVEKEIKSLKSKEKSEIKLPEETVKEVKRQDISKKGLKEQKQWLIEQLDKAIEKSPEGHKDFGKKYKSGGMDSYKESVKARSEPYELLTFEIPGDGIMKIRNNRKALEQFKKSVEKKWPDKPLKLSKKDLQQG